MPSTPDSILRLELQATGENATTWGTKTNNTIELLGQAIAGAANVNVGGSGNYTLVASNYTTDEARAATLVLTGTLSGNRDVIVPSSPKHYTIINQTSGAFPLTIRQLSGTGVAIPAGSSQIVCTSTTCVGVGINNVLRAGDTMTGALGVIAGTSAAPGVFVSGDTNTGLFQAAGAPDTLSISVGGTEVGRYGAGGFMRLAAGTAAAPAYSFSGDTDTGIYGAVGQISFSIDGAEKFRIASDRAIMRNAEPMFMADKAASGADSIFRGATNNSTRWDLILGNSAAEAGSNAGSDFAINRCDDAGTYLSTPVFIARATGAISLVGPVTVDGKALQIQRGTEVATNTGQVQYDFTGIPAGVRRVTIMFDRLSTNGASDLVFRLGKSGDPAGTFIATGYNGSFITSGGTTITTENSTTGFGMGNNSAARSISGSIVLNALTNSLWTAAGVYGGNGNGSTSGSIDLGGTLDRLRLTTLGGTNTFDAGTINISWEF